MRSVCAAIAASATAGRGDDEVRPVVLADGEYVQTQLVGQARLLQQVAHPLLRCDAAAQIGKGGKSQFKAHADSLADSCVRNHLP